MADIVVIGGGAAGLMAAAAAAGAGKAVTLLEPNPMLGKKLRITGKGRCNLTNNCTVREFLENVPRNGKFLYSALNAFPPSETMAFFERAGVPLKTERGRRVFPESDSAHDVANALERLLFSAGALRVRAAAAKIRTENGAVRAVATGEGVDIPCRAAVLATGGVSYPGTGSTGDGHRIARELGHTVTALFPSLVPLESDSPWCAEMQGFSLKNVTLNVYGGEKLIYSELGELIFTHFGVSGPLVLSASAHMREFGRETYRLSVDLKPGLDEKKLDARLLRDFGKYKNRDFANALDDLAGRAMIPALVRLSGIPGETKVHSVTRVQRQKLASLFKAFPVGVTGPRPIDEAVVTSGGVSVLEADPRSMASKLIKGLFFAGELLDVDAYTGGYNLQIAWSTGRLAGRAAAARCGET